MNSKKSRLVITPLVPMAMLILGTACTMEDVDEESIGVASEAVSAGQQLFDHETFGGNGRTCRTCHSGNNGTITIEQVQERLAEDPSDPLFVHDGLDDFQSGTSRIEAHATILIRRPLPAGVVLVDDPSATSVVVPRGVPSTLNTPALDPALMYDLRNQTLQEQALGAIHGHAQNTVEPTQAQLDAIAEFQETDNRFFSSNELEDFAAGGPPPALPQGHTASEKRGREFFVDAPWDPPSKKGACAFCHSGPMLNTSNFGIVDALGAPPGFRAFDIFVNIRNVMNRPVKTYDVTDACGTTIRVQSPDPGVMLTGVYNIPLLAQFLPPPQFCILHPGFFANFHKTPQLHGVRHTAPYFHDNSAKDLADVLEQYVFFFESNLGGPLTQSHIILTEQDKADIIAFMNLL